MIKHSYLNHVTTLVISRPERRNALNLETIRELSNGISNAESDPNCHCLVITGDGDHFVAGRDLGEANSDASLNETLANDEAYIRILQPFAACQNRLYPLFASMLLLVVSR
jgi:enoyl-CoA hydratase/carnithine racemase